jgi:hypothetical protein
MGLRPTAAISYVFIEGYVSKSLDGTAALRRSKVDSASFVMNHVRTFTFVTGTTVAAAAGVYYWVRSHRKSAEQREMERRLRLSMIGRITDGTVLDVHEIANDGHVLQLVSYSYDVAGVSYEASQDITHLRDRVDVHNCRIGLPASIKYDPHNPGNSIVVSERWMGLRQ